jgi:hypothetical protein
LSDADPSHDDLLAIYSRLGSIEGKVNLLARVDRPQFLTLLGASVEKQPLIGQVYLALNRPEDAYLAANGSDAGSASRCLDGSASWGG